MENKKEPLFDIPPEDMAKVLRTVEDSSQFVPLDEIDKQLSEAYDRYALLERNFPLLREAVMEAEFAAGSRAQNDSENGDVDEALGHFEAILAKFQYPPARAARSHLLKAKGKPYWEEAERYNAQTMDMVERLARGETLDVDMGVAEMPTRTQMSYYQALLSYNQAVLTVQLERPMRDALELIKRSISHMEGLQSERDDLAGPLGRRYLIAAGLYNQLGNKDQAKEAMAKARTVTPDWQEILDALILDWSFMSQLKSEFD